jgi:hypothetical protein
MPPRENRVENDLLLLLLVFLRQKRVRDDNAPEEVEVEDEILLESKSWPLLKKRYRVCRTTRSQSYGKLRRSSAGDNEYDTAGTAAADVIIQQQHRRIAEMETDDTMSTALPPGWIKSVDPGTSGRDPTIQRKLGESRVKNIKAVVVDVIAELADGDDDALEGVERRRWMGDGRRRRGRQSRTRALRSYGSLLNTW